MKKVIDNYQHVAIIYDHNKVICYGYNHYNLKGGNIHAEHHAIQKLTYLLNSGKIKKKRYSIFVARINNNMETRLSKPCESCQRKINDCFLIKKVDWTT